MTLKFDKYQGAGNDFIILNNYDGLFSQLSDQQFREMCDRNRGIGADGIILLEPSDIVDFEMKYYNSDGKLSSLCGNGARCLVLYAFKNKIIGKKAKFNAIDGVHEAWLTSPEKVKIQINEVKKIFNHKDSFVTNTGSPHYVKIMDNILDLDVKKEGSQIRFSKDFTPDGINVNFLKKRNNSNFSIRTYERGVEDETLACGTGAVAAAIVMHYIGETSGKTNLNIETLGGNLKVDFDFDDSIYKNIFLEGPANYVFSGIYKT
ncbi:diaminopimelate epimerase [bacterium]|nr:diaminopimelate epimerase [bacterium]